jgi:hypothetical protein
MTNIKIEFEKGGVFFARLLEDEAPKSCQAILKHLNFEYEFKHSSTSGQAVVTLPSDFSMEKENQRTIAIYPGSICFLVRDPVMRIPDEIYITYGPYFISRGFRVDYQEPINVIAKIDENLEELEKIGARFLKTGSEKVKFSKVED